ncbi:MAG: CopD family protein [Flavobacterium sp.]|jgi:putative membrane protein
MDIYNILKSLHIIFVITWFAGLFYIIRLFVYHVEALEKPEPEKTILSNQYKIMENRLWYIITIPSAILTFVIAFWLLLFTDAGMVWLQMPWMHIKLIFVFLLYVYMYICHLFYNQLQNDICKKTSLFFRIWNEVATVILLSIVFLVVMKNELNWLYAILGMILVVAILMIAIKWYKKIRK